MRDRDDVVILLAIVIVSMFFSYLCGAAASHTNTKEIAQQIIYQLQILDKNSKQNER